MTLLTPLTLEKKMKMKKKLIRKGLTHRNSWVPEAKRMIFGSWHPGKILRYSRYLKCVYRVPGAA